MPIGSTSQAFTPTIYTSMVAATYKANIDADTAILSNPGGGLYVYPNNPAALSVLVDPAFNIPAGGGTSPFFLNGTGSAITVSLTAPGSNSYYATIYWDYSTNSVGVVYGATGVSPTPVLPDLAYRVPLAVVLLTAGQATVVASNISDVRTWLPEGPVLSYTSTTSTGLSINCNGASLVQVSFNFTAAITVSLFSLRMGVPVNINAGNSSGGALVLRIAAGTPAGTTYSTFGKIAGASTGLINLTTTGISIPSGVTYALYGETYNASGTPALILPFA
jgi:hypothetical protein